MRNNLTKLKANEAFIALTSAIIISAVLLTIVLAVSLKGFSIGQNVNNSYYKQISLYVAEACANKAMLNLTTDLLYTGNETITVGADSCDILEIQNTGDIPPNKIIQATAEVVEARTRLEVVFDQINAEIISWEEVDSF